MPTPYNVSLILYDIDGSTPAVSKLVTIRDETTAETTNGTTNGSGEIILNAGNLTGFAVGNTITIYSVDGDKSAYEVYVTAGGSYNTTLTYVDTSVSDSTELRYFTAAELREYFCLATYNSSSAPSGIKTEQIERIGEGVEGEIDRILQQKFDDNDGSNYTSTDEYHNAIDMYQKDYFSDWGPILSVTKFEVNEEGEGLTPTWNDLVALGSQYYSVDLETGRFRIEDSIYYPLRGARQVRLTYTYGASSVPKDIKRLAMLMTGRELGSANLVANAISGTEMEGSGGSINILDSNMIKNEIKTIINSRIRIIAKNI